MALFCMSNYINNLVPILYSSLCCFHAFFCVLFLRYSESKSDIVLSLKRFVWINPPLKIVPRHYFLLFSGATQRPEASLPEQRPVSVITNIHRRLVTRVQNRTSRSIRLNVSNVTVTPRTPRTPRSITNNQSDSISNTLKLASSGQVFSR